MDSLKEHLHDLNWNFKIAGRENISESLNESNSSVISILPPVKTVLDVGCGTGELMLYLKKKGISTEGVDISKQALLIAKKRGLNAHKFDADKKLPFKGNSFDCVICNQVLMHVLDPVAVLAEMKRISRRYVLINVPNHLYWRFRAAFLFGKLPLVLLGRFSHIRIFSLAKIREIINSQALYIITEDYTGKKFFPGVFATSFTFLCEKKG